MEVAIISADSGWHIKQLKKAVQAQGRPVQRFSFAELKGLVKTGASVRTGKGQKLEKCDYIFVRIVPRGNLEEIFLRMDLLHVLQEKGVKLINPPESIEKTVNKYYTSSILAESGLPSPDTISTENFRTAMNFFEERGDVILKPLFGSLGRGMVRLTDEETAYRVFRAWEMNNYVYYLQEFIPHDHSDIRVFVCGGEIIDAYIRSSNSWKTNIARGGQGQKFQLTEKLRRLALKASSLFELDYCGVDIILKHGDREQPYVIEINSIPGWAELKKVTGQNIAKTIVNKLLD